MKIHFNGAARTVTGSQHLLEINGKFLLLECGLFQGRRSETYEKNLNFSFNPHDVDAMILSHAHIDHSGNIPNLVKMGFNNPIYATHGTAKLAEIMLQDSAHIQEYDAKYVNKKHAKKGLPPVEPLYTKEDALEAIELFQPIEYKQAFQPIEGVVAHFYDAGHILGSASVVLDITERGRQFRLWFSGDIGRLKLPLLRDPVLPSDADYLIMESTYGDKAKRDPMTAYEEFKKVVSGTIKRGGKVIIPAFAVGRTQELVYCINQMISEGSIPKVPVFVDSPLAVNATTVFRQFPQYFDEETYEFIRTEKHPALMFDGLRYTQSVDESKALNTRKDPMIIISASGMAETGRIVHHIKNNVEDPRNTILIVSWQAPHTLGRRLADRVKQIKIYGDTYNVRAQVETINGLSAHGGQDMLMNYARASKDSLKQIFLVHGEERGSKPLMELIRQEKIATVLYPEAGQIVDL
ncbi:MAG: MBL fold metallo-hydrolase [Anaerolineaceae bacterium]|nr:MBL fold metallo-hydrolase [Anaerolineaceae bacterium]